jgi:hypothetical protein
MRKTQPIHFSPFGPVVEVSPRLDAQIKSGERIPERDANAVFSALLSEF